MLRTDVFELIHYRPRTPEVHEVPMLIVLPTINKFYVLDLAPGRSLVEHLLGDGQQVFAISWRNPGAEHGHWDLDTYAEAVIEARAAAAEITGSDSVHVTAACSGGIIAAGALASLRPGDIASPTLLVCALDNARAGTAAALAGREVAAAAVAESAPQGLPRRPRAGRVLRLAAAERPDLGLRREQLPARQEAAHVRRPLLEPGHGPARGRLAPRLHPHRTRQLACPRGRRRRARRARRLGRAPPRRYVVAGLNDHIVPWENAYRSARLLGGDTRFVLSTSGHIQALVNPPAPQSRASYRAGTELPGEPEAWLGGAATTPGSWWPDWSAWLRTRSGPLRASPAKLGSRTHRAAGKAPGTYVHAT